MPSFQNHPVSDRNTILVVGDPGIGKSSLYASLANAGYKVNIVDFDNGLDPLANYLTPEGAARTHYVTLKDTNEKVSAWADAKKIWNSGWKVGTEELGKVTEWGPDTVLGIDSLTFAGYAAIREAARLNGKKPDAQLAVQEWGEAVRSVGQQLDYLTGGIFKCQIVMTAIPVSVDDDTGVSTQYPQVVTKNFSQSIGRYFNNVFRLTAKRDGTRVLKTSADNRMTLRNSAPSVLQNEEPADLAAILEKIRKNAERLKKTA